MGDALDNAKKFVQDYLSQSNKMFENKAEGFGPYIAYIGENPDSKRFLVSTEESIDRAGGTYAISRSIQNGSRRSRIFGIKVYIDCR